MIKRRQVVQLSAGLLAYPALRVNATSPMPDAASSVPEIPVALPLIQRPIPSTGELLPVMGMGTSRTFDIPGDAESLAPLTEVMQLFFAAQGKVIDSSPMYGNAETRVGDVLRAMKSPPPLFAATKVWTTGKERGIAQMEESAWRMNVKTFDLIAVHNPAGLADAPGHAQAVEGEGKVRYIGITTSHGRDHDQLLEIMRSEPLDFVQFSYNIEDREAEQALLPLAQDRGIATMINRPCQMGALFGRSHDHPPRPSPPSWTAAVGRNSS
ncbi:MAG: aldo/keto reductase [Haliea sp.]|nr:aldo/keto reductase [Haliea sp.]